MQEKEHGKLGNSDVVVLKGVRIPRKDIPYSRQVFNNKMVVVTHGTKVSMLY